MRKISEVKSYLFDNHIILSLSQEWLNAFNQLPEFDVLIDDKNRLQLVSKQELRMLWKDMN